MPTSVAYIGTGQIMGWGNKAIEVSEHAFGTSSDHFNGLCPHYRYVPLRAAIWMVCSCTKRRSAWNSFASETTKYSSAVPKVLHRVKSTLWRSTSRAWPIGNRIQSKPIQFNPIQSTIDDRGRQPSIDGPAIDLLNRQQNQPINIFFLFYHKRQTKMNESI